MIVKIDRIKLSVRGQWMMVIVVVVVVVVENGRKYRRATDS